MNYNNNQIHPYRKIAFNFLFISVILAVLVIYFVFYQVKVHITPAKEKIVSTFLIQVQEDGEEIISEGIINGTIDEKEAESEREFSASAVKEKFFSQNGKVFIINTADFNQPLVVKTRLLTVDNILFKIKNGVTVPAGGEVEVEVYPSDKNFNNVIKPSKMTIPGLSSSLQEKIYAENRQDLGGTKEVKTLSQEDIDIAIETLSEDLYKQIKSEFVAANSKKINFNLLGKIPKIKNVDLEEVVLTKVDKNIGDECEKFKLFLKAKVMDISFDENKIEELANKKILDDIPDDKKFIKLDKRDFNYVVEKYDLKKKIAYIKVYISGEMAISEESKRLDKSKFVGMSFIELKNYLKKFPSVEDVEVSSVGSWFKTVPNNKNKIKIIIKN
ncbi:MAG: hypothetical protein U9O66_03095 [Patescibacteria group bacterium]|nr:hypothetical protein [Patescibacteria group bacterium]